jgi:adenylate kinase
MDGFPRTIPQAEAFDEMLEKLGQLLDSVVLLDVDKELLVRRLVNRRTCRSCGKIWNLLTMQSPGEACSECGGELYQRDDDAESVVRNRLEVYRKQTAPLVEWYEKKGKLHGFDAMNSPDKIFKEIRATLE